MLISQLFLVLLTAMPQGQVDPQRQAMSQGAQRCIKALTEGDYKTLAELTHPVILERLGGKEKMAEVTTTMMDQMSKQGVKFLSAKADNPSNLIKGKDGLYGLVPTTIVLDTPQVQLTLKSYMVGFSSDEGKTWVYIDGAPGPEKLREDFQQIPQELELPERQQPKIEPKSKD